MNWRAYEMDLNIDKRIAREEGREEGRAEGREVGREEGREEGRAEGEYKQLIRLTCKKKAKGFGPEKAAEQLESDEDEIRRIYEAIDAVGTVEDVDAIYGEFLKFRSNAESSSV